MVDEVEKKLSHFLFKTSAGTIQFLTSETFGTYAFLGVRRWSVRSHISLCYVYADVIDLCAYVGVRARFFFACNEKRLHIHTHI